METLVLIVLAVACCTVYVQRKRPRDHANTKKTALHPEARNIIKFDDQSVLVTYPNGEVRSITWEELTMVGIRTTDEGPFVADVFWGLHGEDGQAKVVYPGGATGEELLLTEMQRRLAGFNNRQLIDAMGSTSNAFFLIWKREASSAQ